MLDTLTTEILLSLAITSSSALAVVGALLALRGTRQKGEDFDIDAAVRDAPYTRLHNIVRLGEGR